MLIVCVERVLRERFPARAGVHRETSVNEQTYELFRNFAYVEPATANPSILRAT